MEPTKTKTVDEYIDMLQKEYAGNPRCNFYPVAMEKAFFQAPDGVFGNLYKYKVVGDPFDWLKNRVEWALFTFPDKDYHLAIKRFIHHAGLTYVEMGQDLSIPKVEKKRERKQRKPKPATSKRESKKAAARGRPYDFLFEG